MGPALGGALAQPVRHYPSWFSKGTIFDTYPFLLSNLVCVAIIGGGLAIGTLFLQETHAEHKERRDLGVQLGDWLIRKLTQSAIVQSDNEKDEVCSHLLMDKLGKEKVDSYTDPKSKTVCSKSSSVEISKFRSIGAQKAFTRPVAMNIVAFGIMA